MRPQRSPPDPKPSVARRWRSAHRIGAEGVLRDPHAPHEDPGAASRSSAANSSMPARDTPAPRSRLGQSRRLDVARERLEADRVRVENAASYQRFADRAIFTSRSRRRCRHRCGRRTMIAISVPKSALFPPSKEPSSASSRLAQRVDHTTVVCRAASPCVRYLSKPADRWPVGAEEHDEIGAEPVAIAARRGRHADRLLQRARRGRVAEARRVAMLFVPRKRAASALRSTSRW